MIAGVVALAAVVLLITVYFRGIPVYEPDPVSITVQSDSLKVANGARIAAVQCMVCHRGKDNKLSGRLLQELPPDFGTIYSANITQSTEHGIGKWSDADIYRLLRTGVKPNGQFIPNYMPKFPHMSEYDIESIIAWLRSGDAVVQASDIAATPSEPSFLTKFLCYVAFKKIDINKAPIAEPDTNNLEAYGRYLVVGRYDCYPCHSADFKTLNQAEPEKTGGYLGGGNKMVALNGNTRLTANITMDEATGLGTWTLEDFTNALRNSKSKNGQPLRDPMLPYNGLTDLEIKAMWKYLQTVPVISNKVERHWDEE